MLYTESRLISVVLKRRGGRVKVRGCLVLMVEDTSSFGKAVIRELLVFVCLLLRWIDSVVNVVRVNERIKYVKLVIGKQIVNIVSAYAPQVGLSAEEKDDFWDSFIIVLSGIPKQESIFIGSDMNGHVGRDADGYGGIHGGMGFCTRNAEGERILEFGDAVGMVVCNTFFKKEDSKLITYQSGDNRSISDGQENRSLSSEGCESYFK